MLDAETSSFVNIKKEGMYRYWEHPESRVLMISHKFLGDTSRAELTDYIAGDHPGHLPMYAIHALRCPKEEVMLAAANCEFDRKALQSLGHETPEDKWIDILEVAYYLGFAGRLADVLRQTGILEEKNPEGTRLITLFSSQRTPWNHEPEKWQKFREYCQDDTDVEEALLRWCLGFLDKERFYKMVRNVHRQGQIYRRINQRGLPIDREAVRGAIQIRDKEVGHVLTALQELTGLANPNSRDQLLGWLKERIEIFDLQKDTIRDNIQFIEVKLDVGDPVSDGQKEALQAMRLRQATSKTSTKKFDAMAAATSDDGFLRGGWQFYGASRTGRVGGRILNPANLARPGIKHPEWAAELLPLGDRDLLQACFPVDERSGDPLDPMALLSWCIRACLKAPEGQEWCVADLTSIESVGAAWQAGCQTIIDIFKAGRDTYKTFAAESLRKPYDEVTKEERTFAKPCLAGNTQVLTGSGWKNIPDVQLSDKLWDGVEWVQHGGAVLTGFRPTITRAGVTATSDHEFWEDGRWVKFKDLESEYFNQDNASVNGLSWDMEKRATTDAAVIVAPRLRSIPATSRRKRQKDALSAPPKKLKNAPQHTILGSQGTIGFAYRIGSTPCAGAVRTLKTSNGKTMGRAGSTANSLPLRSLSGMWSRWRAGITRILRSTVSTTKLHMHRVICDSLIGKETALTHAGFGPSRTEGVSTPPQNFGASSPASIVELIPYPGKSGRGKPRSRSLKVNSASALPVYDILGAGPRNRFTIRTERGTAIAHNCVLGGAYMLSAYGLEEYAAGMGVKMDFEEASKQIDAFRRAYHELAEYWRQLKNASMEAVLYPGRTAHAKAVDKAFKQPNGKYHYTYRKWPVTSYYMEPGGKFLECHLPSERTLFYYEPRVEEQEIPLRDGSGTFKVSGVTYMGIDQKATGVKWKRISTHGGKLLENNTQAICRDIMWYGLEQAEFEDDEITVCGDVYDEIMGLTDTGNKAALDRLIGYMTTRAPWMDGDFYLGADGYLSGRYRKD